MAQLKMEWKREAGMEAPEIRLPEGYEIRRMTRTEADEDAFLDVMMHGLTDGRADRAYVKRCLYDYDHYRDGDTILIVRGDEVCASITVICDDEEKHGYIHMVACKTAHRGLGLGGAMNAAAVRDLLDRGMETAHLTTDDFRLPAIRSYLRAGFFPAPEQMEQEDMKQRWTAVFKNIEGNQRV